MKHLGEWAWFLNWRLDPDAYEEMSSGMERHRKSEFSN